MGSVNPPKNGGYGEKTRIDVNQPYQVAYWKQRFGVSDQELIAAILAVGPLAKKVESYLKGRKDKAP
jgi:uncharacterized protein DUF3606